MIYTMELSDAPDDTVIYECDMCDRKFRGPARPQDCGDGPMCQRCWLEAGN